MPSYIKCIRQNYLGAMPSAKVPVTGLERGDEVFVTDLARAGAGIGNMCFRDSTNWIAVDTGLPVALGAGAGDAPSGFIYLADDDGSRLTDPDGAYLMEAA